MNNTISISLLLKITMELNIQHQVNLNLKDDLPCILNIWYQSNNEKIDYTDIRFIEHLNENNITEPENIQEIINNPKIRYLLSSELFELILHPDTKIDIELYNGNQLNRKKGIQFQLENLLEISQYPDNCFVKTVSKDYGSILTFMNYKNEILKPNFLSYQRYFDLDDFQEYYDEEYYMRDFNHIAETIEEKLHQYLNVNYPEKNISTYFIYSPSYSGESASFVMNVLEISNKNKKDDDFKQDIMQQTYRLIVDELCNPPPVQKSTPKI